MALVFSDDVWDRWRLPALALAAAAIIVVPWLTLRKLQQDNEAAMAWVTHTQSVGVALQQLQADVRDVESAALTLSKGVDAPGLRERMAKAQDIPGRLAELGRLTRDNPEQLIRIGRIEAMLDGRMALARDLARAEPNTDQRELVQDLSTRYPIRGLVEELQANEQKLLAQRAEQASRQRRQTEFVSWSSLVVQLGLLGLVLWLLQRQIGRRLQAERQSLRAAGRAASVLQTVREPIVLLDRELRVQLHN
ncbi:MAG TPA: histidine kinase, partial [Stenotrophomonas sp.]|nr:histidine kinase [Stenotrophomonas sp.]